jgi:hypothetical protein
MSTGGPDDVQAVRVGASPHMHDGSANGEPWSRHAVCVTSLQQTTGCHLPALITEDGHGMCCRCGVSVPMLRRVGLVHCGPFS